MKGEPVVIGEEDIAVLKRLAEAGGCTVLRTRDPHISQASGLIHLARNLIQRRGFERNPVTEDEALNFLARSEEFLAEALGEQPDYAEDHRR